MMLPPLIYHEHVVFYKARYSRPHNQPAHSEVAKEGQQCTTKTTMDQKHYPVAHQILHQYSNYTHHLPLSGPASLNSLFFQLCFIVLKMKLYVYRNFCGNFRQIGRNMKKL